MSPSKFIRPAALAALTLLAVSGTATAQGVTTSTLSGVVRDASGQPIAGAEVSVRYAAVGYSGGALTNADGRYVLTNLRPGGPYTVIVSTLGYETVTREAITLSLGENRRLDVAMAEQALAVEGIEVTARRVRASTGVRTTVDADAIQRTPTLNREIVDIARLTPQAFVANEDDDGSAISIAGQNNEYNSLYIDGVVNNDVFGLSAQGTNGGQTGAPPISFDAIEQLQIAISPFDVTQGGFTGGAINAVTRSGTNEFAGSLYYQRRGDGLSGESKWLPEPEPLPEFSAERFGLRLGGPIIEDELFFFVNGEFFRSETPRPFTASLYRGEMGTGDLENLRSFLISEVGYDPGGFGSKASTLDDNKLLAKIDWNLNEDHRLALRHSYSHSDNTDAFASGTFTINYENNSEVFPNTTNSTALELNSTFGGGISNRLLIGYTTVRDDRDFAGDPFPSVTIDDGDGSIRLGSEPFSTGNILNQDIFSITNNLNLYRGDHTITIGTHNEFYDIGNLFLRQNFGQYTYASLDDFMQSVRATNDAGIDPVQPESFNRGFSLVDAVAGDGSAAIGAFKAYQLGAYIQDEWRYSDRLSFSGGVRVDIPKITTRPRTNAEIVDQIFPQLAQVHDLEGALPGRTPDAQLYVAPRFGFNYDLTPDASAQLRGGLGVFTGRVPFVYPGAMYLNNGVTAGFVSAGGSSMLPGDQPIPFRVTDYLDASDFGRDVVPSGEVDVFTSDFRYPRVFRSSLGVDFELSDGFLATLEGQYTKSIDNIYVENVNFLEQNDRLDGPDNRPVYNYGTSSSGSLSAGRGLNPFANQIQSTINPVMKVSTTSEGYTYDVTARIAKQWSNTNASLAWVYGDAYSVNDATSDQIFSVWRFNENVNGLNNLERARSDFSIGQRVIATLTHRRELLSNLATTVSAVFSGESGRPFSWIIGNNFNFTGEGSGTAPLAYVPNTASDLLWTPYERDGAVITVEEQMQAFDAFVRGNDYLSGRRGDYAERNGDRAPMEWVVDLQLTQELFGNFMGRRNTVELTLDIFNFTAMLNDSWGRRFDTGFRTVDLVRFEGFEDADAGDLTPVYTFRFTDYESMDDYWDARVLDFGSYGSRWLMQLGARYRF